MARRIKENVLRVVEAPDPDMIPSKPPSKPVLREEGISQPSLEADEIEIPVAPSTVQPERAQQYFENVPDEFGAWHIFVRHRMHGSKNISLPCTSIDFLCLRSPTSNFLACR
jgi:hypothetical protein